MHIVKSEVLQMAVNKEEAFTLFFGEEDSPEFRTYLRLSRKLYGKYIIAHCHEKDWAADYGISFPSITVFKQWDERKIMYTGDLSNIEEITEWVGESML